VTEHLHRITQYWSRPRGNAEEEKRVNYGEWATRILAATDSIALKSIFEARLRILRVLSAGMPIERPAVPGRSPRPQISTHFRRVAEKRSR
jgi:hypothetical protein